MLKATSNMVAPKLNTSENVPYTPRNISGLRYSRSPSRTLNTSPSGSTGYPSEVKEASRIDNPKSLICNVPL